MREIKFRAWDKRNKMMVYEDTYVCDMAITLNGAVWCHDSYYETHNEDFELMQYTGIKDVGGKKIFEGDILENIETKDYGPVDFCYGSFHWNMSPPFPVMNQENGHFLKHRIIGNIYENLELAK